MTRDGLLGESPGVMTLGVDTLADALAGSDATVTEVDWSPPVDGTAEQLTDLAPVHDRITEANEEAVERMIESGAEWTRVDTAAETIPEFDGRMILHAGPPVTWDRMSGPQRGAVIGAAIYEGWASTPEEAKSLASAGEITFAPCHEHSAVGPMAGIVSPSMPVAVVENPVHGNTAYVTFNEGLGKVLRYGAYGEEVTEHLDWMQQTMAPILSETLAAHGSVDLTHISAQALQMGDEVHNRNVAATSLLVRELAPTMATVDASGTGETLSFLEDNDHFFLNLSMGACKLAADAAADIPWSTVVTAMARNGTDFGLRVSGLSGQWFTAEAPVVDGLFFPEYDAEDANPDIGDSSITETTGVGGFAMAGSPGITQFVGGTPEDARRFTREMYSITVGENSGYSIPGLDFRGTPTGIDIIQVLATSTPPIINTGIA
ncbi:MAG: hypothetical protein ACI8TL_001608, partial [Natronomonas sp.]